MKGDRALGWLWRRLRAMVPAGPPVLSETVFVGVFVLL